MLTELHQTDRLIELGVRLDELEQTRKSVCAELKAIIAKIDKDNPIEANTEKAKSLLMEQLGKVGNGQFTDDEGNDYSHKITQEDSTTTLTTNAKGYDGNSQEENIVLTDGLFSVARRAEKKRSIGKNPSLMVVTAPIALTSSISSEYIHTETSNNKPPTKVSNGKIQYQLKVRRLFGEQTLEVDSPEGQTVTDLVASFADRVERALNQSLREIVKIRETFMD